MKKIASLITALVLAASMSLTVSATDYAKDPQYGVPTNEIATVGSGIGATSAKPASVITDGYITEALKATTVAPIYVNDNKAIVTKDTIAAIKTASKPVTFVAPSYSITVDPAKITGVTADLNLGMTIATTSAKLTVSSVSVPANALIIEPAASGNFGMELAITINKSTLNGIDVSKSKMYYIADDGKVTDMGALTVADDGSVTIKISHASQYVISETALVSATAAVTTAATTATAANPATGEPAAPMLAAVALLGLSSIVIAAKSKKSKSK